MADKFVQNVHIANIVCETTDKKLTVTFPIAEINRITGRQMHSGYTRVPKEDYEKLVQDSPLFNRALNVWKKLIVYDDPPAEALTLHDTLMDARKEVLMSKQEIEAAKAEIAELKAKLAQFEKSVRSDEKPSRKAKE